MERRAEWGGKTEKIQTAYLKKKAGLRGGEAVSIVAGGGGGREEEGQRERRNTKVTGGEKEQGRMQSEEGDLFRQNKVTRRDRR